MISIQNALAFFLNRKIIKENPDVEAVHRLYKIQKIKLNCILAYLRSIYPLLFLRPYFSFVMSVARNNNNNYPLYLLNSQCS